MKYSFTTQPAFDNSFAVIIVICTAPQQDGRLTADCPSSLSAHPFIVCALATVPGAAQLLAVSSFKTDFEVTDRLFSWWQSPFCSKPLVGIYQTIGH